MAVQILYQYDISENLVRKPLPDEGGVDYSYDSNNRVTRVADADSILQYGYAPFTGYQNALPGEQTTGLKGMKIYELYGLKGDARYEKQMSGGLVYDYNSHVGGVNRYEVLGQIEMFVDMPDGSTKEIVQHFDSNDLGHRLTRMTAGVPVTFNYDRVGRRTRMYLQWATGFSADYAYDAAGQLLSLENHGPLGGTGGIWQSNYGYTYDAAGNRTSMADPLGTHNFGYDDRYQLTSATHPTIPVEGFGYDSVGNRTTSHISPSYTYNTANQLLDDAKFTYTYDSESGLYFFRARYYDPHSGRFTAEDLVGELVRKPISLHVYVYDNPLTFVDPLGRHGIMLGGRLPPCIRIPPSLRRLAPAQRHNPGAPVPRPTPCEPPRFCPTDAPIIPPPPEPWWWLLWKLVAPDQQGPPCDCVPVWDPLLGELYA